jgi:solute:Na+ symporter, SSS family
MTTEIHLGSLDFLVIAAYVVALLIIGFWVSFRQKRSSDIFLAGRQLTWPNIGLSIWSTNINPSVLLQFCSTGYLFGMAGGNFSWLAWPFLMLLAMVFIPHYLNTKVSTMPEFLSRRFGPSCRNFLSWYVLFITLVIWLGFTLYASGLIISPILHWPFWVSIIAMSAVALSFTVTGGLAAVVITGSFQAVLMILASLVLTIIAFYHVGGVQNLIDRVPPDYWRLFRSENVGDLTWYALLLGYPVAGIWFWCTDQTIVQRVLGAKDVKEGQLSAMFTGFLKILDVVIFLLPGIICKALHPDLNDPDGTFLFMVGTYMPAGVVGLVVALIIAALISTIQSGLNSFGTVFTLDIYFKDKTAHADPKRITLIGRIMTIVAAVLMVMMALGLKAVKDFRQIDLLTLGQSLIGFLAPPMAVVFLVGVLWRRATEKAAFITMAYGSLLCIIVGICWMTGWPKETMWPYFRIHWPAFPLLSFLLFAVLIVAFILLSLCTAKPDPARALPTLKETYALHGRTSTVVWLAWLLLAAIMTALYIFFN